RRGAARVADVRFEHAGDLSQEVLHAPKTPARADRRLERGLAIRPLPGRGHGALVVRVHDLLRLAGHGRAIGAVAFRFETALRDESEGRGVDAEPEARGRRAILEDVAEVRISVA